MTVTQELNVKSTLSYVRYEIKVLSLPERYGPALHLNREDSYPLDHKKTKINIFESEINKLIHVLENIDSKIAMGEFTPIGEFTSIGVKDGIRIFRSTKSIMLEEFTTSEYAEGKSINEIDEIDIQVISTIEVPMNDINTLASSLKETRKYLVEKQMHS